VSAASEQRQFERAVKAYRLGDYRRAVELFDRFLADYPASSLAADASLYKAECYLKQSSQ
jgi:TolA-binding protein